MRLLLIGGTGFIGRFVAAQLLEQGHDVTVFHRAGAGLVTPKRQGLERRPAREILGDRRRLSDFTTAIRAAAPDVVIDLILSSGRQAREVIRVVRGATSRIVALSSCDVYRACGVFHGSEPGPLEPLPLTERSALRRSPQTYPPDRIRMLQQVFGWLDDEYDKIPVEEEILGARDLDATVLRLPMVYGPGDPLHRHFPLLKRMDDGRRAILIEERQAAWRGPWGYVENVAAAIALAATRRRAGGGVFNVAETDNRSGLEWARDIASITGWPGTIHVLPAGRIPVHLHMPGNLDQHWVVDTTRIREALGYVEPIARREALERTIAWERANPPAIDPRAFDYAAEDEALQNRS